MIRDSTLPEMPLTHRRYALVAAACAEDRQTCQYSFMAGRWSLAILLTTGLVACGNGGNGRMPTYSVAQYVAKAQSDGAPILSELPRWHDACFNMGLGAPNCRDESSSLTRMAAALEVDLTDMGTPPKSVAKLVRQTERDADLLSTDASHAASKADKDYQCSIVSADGGSECPAGDVIGATTQTDVDSAKVRGDLNAWTHVS